MLTLVVLLTAHFIGDFLLQSDRMAAGKSKRWAVLGQHVAVYTLVLTAAAFLLIGPAMTRLAWFAALTFALHFLTDAVTSRITSRLWFLDITPTGDTGKIWRGGGQVSIEPLSVVNDTGTRHWFFVAIGADQLLHVYALAWAWWWVSSG